MPRPSCATASAAWDISPDDLVREVEPSRRHRPRSAIDLGGSVEMETLGKTLRRGSMTRVDAGEDGRPVAEDARPPHLPGTGAFFLTGTWFGLVTGLLELGLRLGQQLWDHRVTVESIRTNHHWIWMAPLSDVL